MRVINNLNVPENWSEVSFGTYKNLSGINLGDQDTKVRQLNSSIQIIATLTKSSVRDIEKMKASDFIDVQSTVRFIENEIPRTNKVKWKFTKLNELTMDKWMAYEQYKLNPEENMVKILSILQNKYSEKDIKELGVGEVLNGFFILQRNSNRFIKRSQRSLQRKIVMAMVKMSWKNLLVTLKLKK